MDLKSDTARQFLCPFFFGQQMRNICISYVQFAWSRACVGFLQVVRLALPHPKIMHTSFIEDYKLSEDVCM